MENIGVGAGTIVVVVIFAASTSASDDASTVGPSVRVASFVDSYCKF